MERTRGARLANALQRALDAMTAEVREELAANGHPGTTTTHHWAMEAIDAGASDASALGRALGISRQAAAKTIASLEQLGYVSRGTDSGDARRRPLEVTARGREHAALGAAAFERILQRLEAQEGAERVAGLDELLRAIPEVARPASSRRTQ